MKRCLALALLLASSLSGFAQDNSKDDMPKLYPGAKAPTIEVAEWVKNGPPSSTRTYKVYELWATWCSSCKETIPFITQCASYYKGKVEFAGISILEQAATHKENIERVRKYVTEMGAKMNYHVGIDAEGNKTAKAWYDAIEIPNLPVAFIVNPDGIVLWIGHPGGIAMMLEDILAGRYDLEEAKASFVKDVKTERNGRKLQKDVDEAVKQYESGQTFEAETTLNEICLRSPQADQLVKKTRLTKLYKPGSEESNKLVDELLLGDDSSKKTVIDFAESIIASGGDKANAKRFIVEASKTSRNPMVLYYAANAAEHLPDNELARSIYTRGIEMCDASGQAEYYAALKMIMIQYRSML